VGVLRALLIFAAFLGVAIVPCALCMLIVAADEAFEHVGRALRRWRRRLLRWMGGRVLEGSFGRRWRLVRLTHALKAPDALEDSQPSCPPIQQVAADLRRLNRQRVGIATRSPVWFTAVQRAYDDRLRVACEQLGIEQHLGALTGIDLDLERVRIEGQLEAAGLAFRDGRAQHHPGQR
jgi:hypothetical protein